MTATYAEFRDAHVLVTGAAAGIGLATARAFAAQGARVTAVDREAQGLARLAGDAAIAIVVCDLSDPNALADMAAAAEAEARPLRVLVNNAGVDRRHDLGEIDAAGWRQMLALNLDPTSCLPRRWRRAWPGVAVPSSTSVRPPG